MYQHKKKKNVIKGTIIFLAILLIYIPARQTFAIGEQSLVPSGGGGVPGTGLPKVETSEVVDTPEQNVTGKVGQANSSNTKGTGGSTNTKSNPLLNGKAINSAVKKGITSSLKPITKLPTLSNRTKMFAKSFGKTAALTAIGGALIVGIVEHDRAVARKNLKQADGGAIDVAVGYRDVDFKGDDPVYFKVTDQEKLYGNLNKAKFGSIVRGVNDYMSSFKLRYFDPQGNFYPDSRDPFFYLQATLFTDSDYTGTSYQIRTEVANLDDTPIKNHTVSSVTIEKIPKEPGIYVFSDKNFNGIMQYFPPGQTKNIDIPIGSLEVVGGQYQALLYKTPDLTGDPVTYRTYSKDLSKEPIGANTIKSIDVKSFNTEYIDGVHVYELPNYNGRDNVLIEGGYYDETVFKDFHEGGFRSIKVNGIYDISSKTGVSPALKLKGDTFVDEDTGAPVKELEVKKEKPKEDSGETTANGNTGNEQTAVPPDTAVEANPNTTVENSNVSSIGKEEIPK